MYLFLSLRNQASFLGYFSIERSPNSRSQVTESRKERDTDCQKIVAEQLCGSVNPACQLCGTAKFHSRLAATRGKLI